MIEIGYLVDHLECIPALVVWFRAQWPVYYADSTTAEMADDFREDANRDEIPVRLVAFADGELAGTIILRDQATWTLPDACPGLGGLLVVEGFRGRGICSRPRPTTLSPLRPRRIAIYCCREYFTSTAGVFSPSGVMLYIRR
jgi:hypothetical protein